MFCPRCGSPNPDTTKFCRQCGLGLTPVSSYIATGGTGQLTPTGAPVTSQLAQITAGYSPKQKMMLAILCLVFLPGVLAILTDHLGGLGDVMVPLAGMLMCVGIPWVVIHFRNQARRLAQEQWQRQMQMNQMQMGGPPVQPYLPPSVQPAPSQAVLRPTQHPVYQTPPASSQQPPNTNPLGTAPSSVVEDETKRLPDKQS